MEILNLSGIWNCEIPGRSAPLRLPGTLDESGIGDPDDPARQWKADEVRRIGFWHEGDPIVTRLTRKYTYEGPARISRTLEWTVPEEKRIFLDVERARHLRLTVNGQEVDPALPGCLSAPYTFELTGFLSGNDTLEFISDNSYPSWTRNAIVYSSAASDETQTNWNGLLGFIRLRAESPVFISGVRVYPMAGKLDVIVEMDAAIPWSGSLTVRSDALTEEASLPVRLSPGRKEIVFSGLALNPAAEKWDLEEGILHRLSVSGEALEQCSVFFGIREFSAADGHLALNGRRIFLRSEANCAVFPETGYIPTDPDAWRCILQKYRDYGVNCLRFHSHCPPDAAFLAADEMGMLMQPELSHWDPEHAFATEEARSYYRTELLAILRHLSNHPSFVMLTFGNELQADEAGHRFMDSLLKEAKRFDPTRLYANGSNVHYGAVGSDPSSDFYTSTNFFDLDLRAAYADMRGWLNQGTPDTRHDYTEAVHAIRAAGSHPVFSFEVGQFEVLPDFDEIRMYQGITSPENLKHIRRKVAEKGLEPIWHRMVEATGESSLLCYRAEVEAALRTEGYSGISLLGLQDFPGQGTALVGMMNAHLAPKPYAFADPARFRAFFRDTLPLLKLPGFTFTAGDSLAAPVLIAHWGKTDLHGPVEWTLSRGGYAISGGTAGFVSAHAGGLREAGMLTVSLPAPEEAEKLTLTVSFCGNRNEYPLWVYPNRLPACPASVHECRRLDEAAVAHLRRGGTVYLSPDSTEEAMPRSLPCHFSPDFWSVCTFPTQTGTMGQLIDDDHPLFRHFPTESFSNWQWARISRQRAFLLPEKADAIITEMDSYAYLRPMAKLLECRCEGGRLLASSLGLQQLQQFPEARCLLGVLYDYLVSDDFRPMQELSAEWIGSLLT